MSQNVSLISPQDAKAISDPSDFDRLYTQDDRDKLRKKFTEPRETVPIGKPGLSCQNNLFLGFFFDGTRNNYALSTEADNNTHSNVARLYDAYPGQRIAPARVLKAVPAWPNESNYANYIRVYTPGVGTPFEEVRDTGQGLDATMGAANTKKGSRSSWRLNAKPNPPSRHA